MKAPDLSVVLPALDEAPNLERLIPALRAQAGRLGLDSEFIVVDGPSIDGTRETAARLGARVLAQKGQGYGAALSEGLAASAGEWVLTLDADGSHAPEDLPRLWAAREGRDLLVGSRYCAGGRADMPPARQVLSRALNLVSRLWLGWGVRDSSSGFRLYRGEAARAAAPRAEAADFTVQQRLLLLILGAGGAVAELPIRYRPREAGVSKASALRLAPAYARLLLEARPERAGQLAALALAAGLGLLGLGWGLPGPARLRAFPPQLMPSPEVARRLTESWNELYRGVWQSHRELASEEPVTYAKGVEEFPPGWSWPPGMLVHSYRALLLRTRNPDEQKSFVVLSQMRPWRLEFQPLYVQYGGAFIYPLGAFLYALKLAGLLRLVPDLSFYLQDPAAMGRLFLGGRVFVLLFHLAAVLLLFGLGRRIGSPGAGAAAGALLGLMPAALAAAHVVKPHAVAAAWALACLAAALDARAGGGRRAYLLAGLCAGLSAGASFGHAPFALAPLAAWLERRRRRESGPGELVWALGAAALAAAVFAALNPYFLLRPRDYLWELTVYGGAARSPRLLGPLPALLFVSPARSCGAVLVSLGWLGWLRALRADARRRFLAVTVAALFAAQYILLARSWGWLAGAAATRFFYPFLALAALFAADLALSLPRRWAVLVLALAFAETGWRAWPYAAALERDALRSSTWERAGDWIEAHVPPGASVGLGRYPHPSHTPPFRYDRYRLVVLGEGLEGTPPPRLPEWLVVDASYRPGDAQAAAAGYHLEARFRTTGAGAAAVHDESFFADRGFDVYRRERPK